MMTFRDELAHVMAPYDEQGKTLVVCGPEDLKDYFKALGRQRKLAENPGLRKAIGAVLPAAAAADHDTVADAFFTRWVETGEDVACIKRSEPDGTPYACVVYVRHSVTVVESRMTLGRRTNIDAIRRAMWDVGIREMYTYADADDTPQADSMKARGWTFEPQHGRFFARYLFPEVRP